MNTKKFANPFRPGAGHAPPYLAGRELEKEEFRRLLDQDVITDNPILTGLRGVGKTVLLEELKPIGIQCDWLWVGTDMAESASLSEENLAVRLLADLSAVTSLIAIEKRQVRGIGFNPATTETTLTLNYSTLHQYYQQTPGLVADKLKAVLELVARCLPKDKRGIVFAYDEAQNLADHAGANQYPLSLLIDVFQSIQRKGICFMLVLVGLPTLFPKLVEARTSAERMFHVMTLNRLSEKDSRAAIEVPIKKASCPVSLAEKLIVDIVKESGGYPYFIQFICREVYDIALQKIENGEPLTVSIPDTTRKLDADFFSGRWARATDRQRDLLRAIADLETCDSEFTVQEVVQRAKEQQRERKLESAFSASSVNQILSKLSAAGFVYKNRHGKYSFAIPLLSRFIRRLTSE